MAGLSFPAAGYLSDGTRTNAEEKAAIEAWLARCKQLPGGAQSGNQKITSGVVTPDRALLYLQPESGSNDDLDGIVGLATLEPGFVLIVGANTSTSGYIRVRQGQSSGGQTIFLKSGTTYNVYAGMLIAFEFQGTYWTELGRYEPPWAHGRQSWSAAGTYSWTCPACVTTVKVYAMGGGGGGAGGGGGGAGAGDGGNGSVGGNTTFGGASVTALGGAGGIHGLATGQGGQCDGRGGHGGNAAGALYGRGGAAFKNPIIASTNGEGGAGGNGGTAGSNGQAGGGGGAGGLAGFGIGGSSLFPVAVSVTPGVAYAVVLGAGGSGGAGGTAGTGGGAGAAGAAGGDGFVMLEW